MCKNCAIYITQYDIFKLICLYKIQTRKRLTKNMYVKTYAQVTALLCQGATFHFADIIHKMLLLYHRHIKRDVARFCRVAISGRI